MSTRAAMLVLLLLAGCAMSGAGLFRAGQQAQSTGHLEEAKRAYDEALRAEPNNAQYRRALEEVSRELAANLQQEANDAEQRRDWLAASRTWAKAAELEPSNEEFAVRRDLTLLKSQNLDPDAWYRGVSEVAARHPTHEIVQRTLEKAKKQGYLFRVGLAKREIGLRHYQRAVEHLDAAQKIDPEHPGLSSADLNRARSLALVEQGDGELANNNPVAAVEAYRGAYELMPSSSTKRKLDRTRARAKEILGTLEQARKAANSGNGARAIKLYTQLVRMEGAPPEAAKELAELEQKLIADFAAGVKTSLQKNDLRAAHRHLTRAIEQSKTHRQARELAKSGLDRIERGEPASGLEAITKAELPEGQITAALNLYAQAVAKKRAAEAEALAKTDPAGAQRIKEELDPFKKSVPEVARLEQTLTVGSFTAELDKAAEAAKQGDDRAASEMLIKALGISQAPKDIQEPIREACGYLAQQKYAESERVFREVKDRAPRSRLANAGVEIAKQRRESTEQRALTALEKGDGQETKAVAILEASVGLTPESPYLLRGRETLLSKLTPTVSDRRAAELIELAARLSALAPAARAALAEGAKQLLTGSYQSSERAFAIALERAPEAKVATAGLEFTAARKMAEVERSESAKRAASETIQKRIAMADAKAERKDYAAALAMYDEISRDPGAPSIEAKIAAAETAMIGDLLERADRAMGKSQMDSARRELGEALERLRAPVSAREKARIGLDRISGEPGEGLRLVKSSGISSVPFLASVDRYAEKIAAKQLEETKRIAEKDPNRASEMLRDLAEFEAKLSGINELRRKIKVDAFTAKLDRAQLAAEANNRIEAARVLREVLDETKAPAAVSRGVLAGCIAMEKEKWIEAEGAFAAALAASPESKIADYALDVARTFRKRAEQNALETIRRDKDGIDGAIAVLIASREVTPDDPLRAEAEKILLDRLKRGRRLSNREAADLIIRIASLTGTNDARKGAELLKAGDLPAAATEFNAALAKNPRLEVAKIGLLRAEASLTESVAKGDVPVENEATAAVLRGLLERKPEDEDLLAALTKLVDRVKRTSEPETVARYLTLGAIATGMKGPVRQAVDAGASALAKGDWAEAERALSKAVEIDPASEVARAGYDAAKDAKKTDVVRRVVIEHEAGREDRVKASLSKTLEEGGTVLEIMLAEATRLASLGQDPEAAKILDAANAASEGAAKPAIKRANSLLAAGKHKEAEKAYAEHSENAEVAEAGEKIAFTRHIQRLLDGVRALGRLEDVENSAKSAAEIFAIDPRDSDVKKALGKVYDQAEKAAAAKNSSEMTRMLSVAASVIGRHEELGASLRAMRAGRMQEAADQLRKIGAEFAQESEDEEASEREPVVEYATRAQAAIAKL